MKEFYCEHCDTKVTEMDLQLGHAEQCEICEKILCENCKHEFSTCSRCGDDFCDSCIQECSVCDNMLCDECHDDSLGVCEDCEDLEDDDDDTYCEYLEDE